MPIIDQASGPDPETKPLRILHLEDDPQDARLILDTLQESGINAEVTVTGKRDTFLAALAGGAHDLYLADYKLPAFDGLEALKMVRARWPYAPFIFITGYLGEERAIETLKSGATDYVLKGSLNRLAPALRRALAEAREKALLKAAEEALRQSEARYRSLFENSMNAILLTAADGDIHAANPAACDMLGMCEEEIRRRTLFDLIDRNEGNPQATLNELTRQRKRAELTFMRKDGESVPVEVTSVLLNSGSKAFIIAQDIAERKKSEKAMLSAKEDLELRVQERTQELTRANVALQERSRQLQLLASELTMTEERMRQHLAQVLHDDLQQILVSAKLRLEILTPSPNRETRQNALEVVDMLKQAIQISRSLAAELSPPILHRGGLLPALAWLSRWVLEKQNLSIDLAAEELEPIADDLKIFLFQATRELLLNIVKHAGVKSARIQVAQRDGNLELTVSDAGTGFNPQVLARSEKCDGFGLISIRERIGLLGGRFEIDSSPGRGCRIMLVAPLLTSATVQTPHPPAVTPVAPPGEVKAGARRIRVMIADDNFMVRQELQRVLRDYPDIETVGAAEDGEAAIQLASQLRPDVVLMDLSMPRMDGLTATPLILAEIPGISIIGLSIFEEPEHARAMREAGAVGYLTKGCPPAELAAAIRTCTQLKEGKENA